MFCNFGENVTAAYFDFEKSVYGVSWYMCPVKMQKYFALVLMQVARPLRFKSVGSLDCSHETFKTVRLASNKMNKVDSFQMSMKWMVAVLIIVFSFRF